MMAFDRLDLVVLSIPTIAIHDEGNMLRDGTLAQSAYQQLSNALYRPFRRRGEEEPFAKLGEMGRRHGD